MKPLDPSKIVVYNCPDGHLNYDDRPEGAIIDTIVIHYTVSDYKSSYLTFTAPRYVSAHYLIDRDGKIDNLVPESKRAWHAGKSYWHKDSVNGSSIGIELVNNGSGQMIDSNNRLTFKEIDLFPEEQMISLVALISYIKANNHNIKDQNIVGHSGYCFREKNRSWCCI